MKEEYQEELKRTGDEGIKFEFKPLISAITLDDFQVCLAGLYCSYYILRQIKTHIKKPLKYEPSYILMIGSVLPFGVDVGNEFACIADRNPDCNMLWDASSTEN